MALGKLFLKLWLLLLLTSYTSWQIQTSVGSWQQEQMQVKRPQAPFLITMAESVSWALHDVPAAEWPARYEGLKSRLSYPSELLPLDSVYGYLQKHGGDDLKPYQESVMAGRNLMVSSPKFKTMLALKRLPGSDYVLAIELPPPEPLLIFGVMQFNTFQWLVEILAYGSAVLLWLSLFWRDLKKIGHAAEMVGGGQFNVVVNVRRGSALRVLADSFNQMTERIAALIKSHKELTNAVSHELRTPLARLQFALTLQEESDDPAERAQLARKMQRDINELDALTSEMLTYSRLDRDIPNFALVSTPVDTWLPQIIEEEMDAAKAAGIVTPVITRPGISDPPVEPKFMARAVSNLIRNGLRFAKSKVEVEVARADGKYLIHVDDDGPGIPEANIDQLFVPFGRVDQSRTRETGGLGLGLAIVRRIAERHGGTSIISKSPLGGARITISWAGA